MAENTKPTEETSEKAAADAAQSAETKPLIDPDLRKLADQAIDMWEDYLDTFATDEKAKGEMAKMMAPMQQMFAPWAAVMAKAAQAKTPSNEAGSNSSAPREDHDKTTQAPQRDTAPIFAQSQSRAADAVDSPHAQEVERRMAQLEQRVTMLESWLGRILASATATSGGKN